MSAGEAVTVFDDRRDAERGRRFDNEASVVEEHPHTGDDRRLLDQDGIVGDQEEVIQDGPDGTPAGDAVSDGVGPGRTDGENLFAGKVVGRVRAIMRGDQHRFTS